MNRSASI